MKITGEYRIAASQDAVWAAINDAQVLRRCIPGCEEIVQETPVDWTARVATRVGPLRARFAGRIKLEDLDPPNGCTIRGEGSGGAAGFANGSAIVRLAADGDATILTYDADTQIGGKLAQIGSRLVDSFARKYADDFFASFARIVGGEDPMPSPATPEATGGEPSPARSIPAATLPAPAHPDPRYIHTGWFNSQTFTILVLSALLVFMTIMYATKP